MGIILTILILIATFVKVYYVLKEHNEEKENNISISEVKNSSIDIGGKKTTVYVKNVKNSTIKINTR